MRSMFAIAAFAVLTAGAASASTIYSSFGPGNTYDCCSGVVVTGAQTTGTPFEEGAGFTSPYAANVEQIDIALSSIQGTDAAIVSLWTNSGNVPGTQLASWTLYGLPSWFGNPGNTPVTISGISGVHLNAGASYFLVASPLDGNDDTWDAWHNNNQGLTGQQPVNEGSGWFTGYSTALAFDILGSATPTAVPEPASIALMVGGIAGVARLRRRNAAK